MKYYPHEEGQTRDFHVGDKVVIMVGNDISSIATVVSVGNVVKLTNGEVFKTDGRLVGGGFRQHHHTYGLVTISHASDEIIDSFYHSEAMRELACQDLSVLTTDEIRAIIALVKSK